MDSDTADRVLGSICDRLTTIDDLVVLAVVIGQNGVVYSRCKAIIGSLGVLNHSTSPRRCRVGGIVACSAEECEQRDHPDKASFLLPKSTLHQAEKYELNA